MNQNFEKQRPLSGPIIQNDQSSEVISCCECQKTFSSKFNLRKHIKKFHPDKVSTLAPAKDLEYKCTICKKQFSAEKNLKYHQNICHGINAKPYVCSECKSNFNKKDILLHFANEHNLMIKEEKMSFSSNQAFLDWKLEMEKQSISKYVKRNDTKTKDGSTQSYICHRSGHYLSKGEGKRHIKIKGSNKIDGYCPANITVVQKGNTILVNHVSTHFGHKNDLGRLLLTDQEKQSIALKIASNIPFESILDQERDTLTLCGVERKHLLTKKDLHNIKQCFNIKKGKKHESDMESVGLQVDIIIKELCEKNNNSAQDLEKEKQDLIDKYTQLVNSVENSSQLDKIKKHLKCITADLSDNSCNYSITLNDQSPANKKIITQRKRISAVTAPNSSVCLKSKKKKS